jgi:hypothetical protein
MPARSRPQSNAILYTLITFVGLFIIATTAAVIYYVKFEDQRTIANQSKRDLKEMVTDIDWRNRGKIIGTRQAPKTWLRTMVDYLDETVIKIIGGQFEDTSAEEKVNTVNRTVENIKKLLAREYPDIENIDPNTTGLIQIIKKLKAKLDNTTKQRLALEKQLEELQNKFDDAVTDMRKTRDILTNENKKYRQQVNEIKQKYDELEAFLRKNAEQQIQDLIAQRDRARTERDTMETDMLQTEAKLTIAQQRIAHIQKQIQAIMSPPDSDVPAYKPDGKIIFIDNQIVHLNIGSDDHVYQGLTFTVYDKTVPIPKDGKGKAEIEVFDVGKNIAVARIAYSEKKNPIVVDDIVANLIWDSDKTNIFMIAGEFDLDGDGNIDYDGVDKIRVLIEKWGGKVADTLSIDTDFLVLGGPPRVLSKPTFNEMEVDPMAMQKYEASLQKLAHYNRVQRQAQALYIPVFNTERFLYFIGYKTLAARPGAF